jgi:hypothetical protein
MIRLLKSVVVIVVLVGLIVGGLNLLFPLPMWCGMVIGAIIGIGTAEFVK